MLKSLLRAAMFSAIAFGSAAVAQAQTEPLYLSDVATEAELTADVFGVPMLIDNVAPSKYVARYYNKEANTPIYFLGDKVSFENAYGLLDGDLACGTVAELQPIVLPEANTYYEINLDTDNMEYSVKAYTVEDYMDPVIYETGSYNLNTWWAWKDTGTDDWVPADDAWMQEFYFGILRDGPSDILRMVPDATNKHLYRLAEPVGLSAGSEFSFIFHNWHSHGWWNYVSWRSNDSKENDRFYYCGGGVKKAYLDWAFGEGKVDWAKWRDEEKYRGEFVADNWSKLEIPADGQYMIEFDTHLGCAKMYLEDPNAVLNIEADNADAPVEYFNLQGMRVSEPANGIFIKRQGSKAEKVLVK